MKVTTPACLFGAWVATQVSKKNYPPSRLLDIGTGTGLLALMIAQKNNLSIDAVEIVPETAKQASENINGSTFQNIHIMEGDIRKLHLPQYDIIVSNPPFYENEWRSPDSGRQVAHHSDELSWNELFAILRQQLHDNGRFYLLLPFKRKKDLEKLAAANGFYVSQLVIVKPTPVQSPSVMLVEGSHHPSETVISEMTIKETGDGYSEAFTALLKDYYLYL